MAKKNSLFAVMMLMIGPSTQTTLYEDDRIGFGLLTDADIFDHMGDSSTVKSICDQDDSVNAKCYLSSRPKVYQTSRAVLRIRMNNWGLCSAWLLGDQGHVITNNHCLSSQVDTDKAQFEAMAEGPDCLTNCTGMLTCAGPLIHIEPLTFIKTGGHIEDDWTLLQLPAQNRKEIIEKYGYLTLRASGPIKGEAIYIPQYPLGGGKKIAMKNGKNPATIVDVENDDNYNNCGEGQVVYKADTEGGSSGSPVIAMSDHAVVAVHKCGGCSGIPDEGNSAIHVNSLVKNLNSIFC